MKLLDDRNGSVAMETVMILPIFVIIIFFILQISLVWGAKQMVSYAAYCGARAALVYNPADYDADKQAQHWKGIQSCQVSRRTELLYQRS